MSIERRIQRNTVLPGGRRREKISRATLLVCDDKVDEANAMFDVGFEYLQPGQDNAELVLGISLFLTSV